MIMNLWIIKLKVTFLNSNRTSETVNEEASDQIINEVLPIIFGEGYINLPNGKKTRQNTSEKKLSL